MMMGKQLYRHDMAELIFSGLQRLFEAGSHTDTEIVVNSRTFKCHKCILSSVSSYFDAMFSSGMKESTEGVVNMCDVKESVFENVLQFIYYGMDVITNVNADDLLRVATILDIKPLHSLCESFLIKVLSNDNCIHLWKLGRTHLCKDLEEKSLFHILDNFPDVYVKDEFLALDLGDILTIVKSDDLHVPNEEMVCDAVFSWCREDEEGRRDSMQEIFEYIRLPLVSSEFLLSEVEPNELICDNKRCREILKEAISYQLLPAKRAEINSPRVAYRRHDNFEEVFIVIGGYNVTGAKLTDVIAYSTRRDSWFHLSNLPLKLGREFATCSYGNDIFVSGGSQKLDVMLRYNAEHNQWTQCVPSPQGRRRHVIVAVGECIYTLGGYDDRKEDSSRTVSGIGEYNINTKSWDVVGTLQIAVRSNSSVAYREKVFIFGGICADETETNAVQCFDTRLKVCTVISDMPFSTKLSKSVVCDRNMYTVCTDGTIMEMNEDFQCKVVCCLKNFNRRRFGILHHKGNIVILGGENGNLIYEDMIYADPRNNETSVFPCVMSPPRANFGCAKIFVNKKFLETPLVHIGRYEHTTSPDNAVSAVSANRRRSSDLDRVAPGNGRRTPDFDRVAPGNGRRTPDFDRVVPGNGRRTPDFDRVAPANGRGTPDLDRVAQANGRRTPESDRGAQANGRGTPEIDRRRT